MQADTTSRSAPATRSHGCRQSPSLTFRCLPTTLLRNRNTSAPAGCSMARQAVAAVGVRSKETAEGGSRCGGAGRRTVVTGRAVGSRRYGTGLVDAAWGRMMVTPGLDFGVCTGDRPLQRVCQSPGWQLLPGTVL